MRTLGCRVSPRNQGRDSGRLEIEVSFVPAALIGPSRSETKMEQTQILISFQLFAPSCQMRTKKVQNAKDRGLSGLH
jgi:hypothetical protein